MLRGAWECSLPEWPTTDLFHRLLPSDAVCSHTQPQRLGSLAREVVQLLSTQRGNVQLLLMLLLHRVSPRTDCEISRSPEAHTCLGQGRAPPCCNLPSSSQTLPKAFGSSMTFRTLASIELRTHWRLIFVYLFILLIVFSKPLAPPPKRAQACVFETYPFLHFSVRVSELPGLLVCLPHRLGSCLIFTDSRGVPEKHHKIVKAGGSVLAMSRQHPLSFCFLSVFCAMWEHIVKLMQSQMFHPSTQSATEKRNKQRNTCALGGMRACVRGRS